MAFTYELIDGQRVETNVASAFRRMAADFKRDTGCTLHVRSGTRTDQEQINIFLSRYVTAGNVNGRKVYDTRVWNGTRYYRVSAAGTVAVPKTSNHEENGPNGPRSIDIYDSGSDAGVTSRGSARDKWMERNAGNYGFENEGYNFSEPWHKTYRGTIGGSGGGGGAGFSQEVQNQQAWMKSLGIDIGSYGADGIPGPDYRAAVKVYQQMLVPFGYTGLIDGQWGSGTQTAHEKLYAEKTNPSAFPPFPLPANQWFGPEQGGNNSISGHYSHSEDLKRWQQRMKDRGWIIDPDGRYGPKGSNSTDTQTGSTAKAFQREKGLKDDGLIGPATWNAAWTAPVTPPTTPPTPVDPNPPTTPGNVLDPAAPWKNQKVDSPLASWIGSPNYNNGSAPARPKKDWIVLHWFGSDASLAGNDSHFQNPGKIVNGRGTEASSQYGVGADGTIHQYVLEKDYAHTNGHTEANARSITIEHEGGPNKPITQKTIDASIKLVADIAKRNGIAKLVWLQNIFPHNHFVATQCPGNLDVSAIVTGANKLLDPPVVTPEPDPDDEGEKLLERAGALIKANNEFLADLQKYAQGE